MQLRFTSLTVTSSREDLHLQECAHAGRTIKKPLKNQWLNLKKLLADYISPAYLFFDFQLFFEIIFFEFKPKSN